MRRNRASGSPSPFRALAHHQQAHNPKDPTDSVSLIRSFNVENNPTQPIRPSPLTASTIRDMPLDLVDRMRSFPLFLSAPEDFLLAIGKHLKPQVHGPNENIITEGDDAKAMYWIVRGAVAVTSRDGEAVYAELKAGAFFGEIGVLMKMPRTATIVSRTKCLLLVLKKEDLHSVLPAFPEMEQAIREEGQERLNLLKKKRQDGTLLKSPKTEHVARAPMPGEVSTGDRGVIRDGVVMTSKKRKSPSPSLIEENGSSSVIGNGVISIRRTLKELPLFSTLPAHVLHFLGLSAQPRIYPPFTDIVRQGAPGNDIFFVVRGEAEVIHKKSMSDLTQIRSIKSRPRLKAGQYFGEVSGLGLSEGRTATVRSITTVECLIIPGAVQDELWKMMPPDIKMQVEETARIRYHKKEDEDVDMEDTGATPASKSDPPTPTEPSQTNPPNVTFTIPSSQSSPTGSVIQDPNFRENVEPRDPDPYLSVNMENIRNRRRHSLAPPATHPESHSPKAAGSRRPSAIDIIPLKIEAPQPSPDMNAPAKRIKILPHRPGNLRPVPQVPNDVLVKIFQWLDIGELICLRRVSSQWRKLLSDSPEICQYVDLSHYNRSVTDQVISESIAPFVGERAIVIDLNNCFHVTDEGFSTLWKQCGKNVKSWRMRSVWDISANQILEMCENAKELEEIDWSNCRKVGDNLLGRVVGWVVPEHPPHKQGLMKDRKQSHAHKAHSMPAPGTVIGCPKLNTLNLSYCKHVTDRSMAHLAAYAANRIQSLYLTRCTSITDAGFQAWAQFKFEKLTELCLADCTYLSDNAIVALANSAKNLTSLDLSFCCALSDTATEVVALGLPKLKELKLAFCGSAVSDGSLESIALHLTELVGLSVRGCVRVTGRGVDNILNGCSQLDWLDVSQCRNLEGWLIARGVERWGYDSKAPEEERQRWASPTSISDGDEDMGPPRPIGLGMLTQSSLMPSPANGLLNRRRRPVKFIIEKGQEGLR